MDDYQYTKSDLAELTEWAKALGVTIEVRMGGGEEPEPVLCALCAGYDVPVPWFPEFCTEDEGAGWFAVSEWLGTPDGAMWGIERTRAIASITDTLMIVVRPEQPTSERYWCDWRCGYHDSVTAPAFALALCRVAMAALASVGKVANHA